MIELNYGDGILGMSEIADESVDLVMSDPPYLYLKNQKLDRPFNEDLFFSESKRILKKSGMIVLFGRGESFYRWNTKLAGLGFKFKEEIVWNKRMISSPVTPISRVHETISIHAKSTGIIRKTRVPYVEMKKYDVASISADIKRLISNLKNTVKFNELNEFIEYHTMTRNKPQTSKHNITVKTNGKGISSGVQVLRQITDGMKEKSIIECQREHYSFIHPTQKPIKLLVRLLNLTSGIGDNVVDCFSGSGSAAVSCWDSGRNFKGWEIDSEYFNGSGERLIEHTGGKVNFASSKLIYGE